MFAQQDRHQVEVREGKQDTMSHPLSQLVPYLAATGPVNWSLLLQISGASTVWHPVAFSPLSEQHQKNKMTSSQKTLTSTGMSDLDVASVYGHLDKFTAALVDLDKKDKEAGRKRLFLAIPPHHPNIRKFDIFKVSTCSFVQNGSN